MEESQRTFTHPLAVQCAESNRFQLMTLYHPSINNIRMLGNPQKKLSCTIEAIKHERGGEPSPHLKNLVLLCPLLIQSMMSWISEASSGGPSGGILPLTISSTSPLSRALPEITISPPFWRVAYVLRSTSSGPSATWQPAKAHLAVRSGKISALKDGLGLPSAAGLSNTKPISAAESSKLSPHPQTQNINPTKSMNTTFTVIVDIRIISSLSKWENI